MESLLRMKFLQIKKQPVLHLCPVLFFYVLLLPYQEQAMAGADEEKVLAAFILTEKIVILFNIWYQYLDFKLFFYRDLKELSFVGFTVSHLKWLLLSRAAYLIVLFPFLLVFRQAGITCIVNCFAVFIIQVLEISGAAFLVMEISWSSVIGAVFASCYIFICINGILPGQWNVLVLDVNPYMVDGNWFLVHGVIAGILYWIDCIGRRVNNKSI